MKSSFLNFLWLKRKKLVVWGAAGFLFYSVVGFFVLPLVARSVVVKQLSKRLDRPVTIRTCRFNPFKFSGSIRDLSIEDTDGKPLVSWSEVYFDFQPTSLFSRAWLFKEVTLSKPFLSVCVRKDYTLNFSEIVKRLSPILQTQATQIDKPRSWRIDRLVLTGGKVVFTDLTTRVPFQRTVYPLAVTVTDFQTDSDHKNAFTISGISDGGERLSWIGSFCLEPLRSEGEVSLEGFALTTYAALYQDLFRFTIKDGIASLHSSYRYERSAKSLILAVTNTTLELKAFELVEHDTGRPAVSVSSFVVTGASGDAIARRAEANKVSMSGGRFVLIRNKDTSVNAIELLKPADSAPAPPGGVLLLLRAMTNLVALVLNTTNLAKGTIGELNVTNCALHLEDLVNSQPVRFDLEEIAIAAKDLSNRTDASMTAEASLRVGTNGTARASLQAGLSPPNAEVRLALDKLNLLPLAPYLEPYLDIFALGSKLGVDGTIRLSTTRDALPEVRFQGDAWLDGFSLAEGVATEGLLKWDSLWLSGITANLNPPVISVTMATLEDVFARLIIETNRTINLMSALRRGGTNVAVIPPNSWAVTPPRLSLGSIVLSNANVHFIDRSLHPNVNVLLENLNGTLSRISDSEPQPAEIHLQGTVDKTARADIAGTISPWDPKRLLDITVSLEGMDLLPEDPYSSKYLGFRLKKGELSAQLRYHVSERKIKSENRLTLKQLSLGSKVESPDATRLPVRLAIALLKDRDGKIVLDLPVSGSLDDPKFNAGEVVYHALETVLVKIVSSPFAALGALFAAKGEELSFQEFQPGSTNLLPAAMAKLDILARGLYERPELELAIEGSADPVTDLAALRLEKMRQQMPVQRFNPMSFIAVTNSAVITQPTGRTFGKTVPDLKGASSLRSPIAFWPAGTNRSDSSKNNAVASPRMYAEDKGATALMQMSAPLGKTAEDPVSDRTLLESVVILPQALTTLANERAGNVRAYLIETGKVQPQRITESARGEGSKGSRVYLWLR